MLPLDGTQRESDSFKDVWILGAGFSRQMHNSMPLMTGLAEGVRDIVSSRFGNPRILANVESVLSELRTDTPWKSPARQHTDLALYEMALERIRSLLNVPYDELRSNGGEPTLGERLVNAWHINGSHILTFNYDLVVESVLGSIESRTFRDDDERGRSFCWPHSIYPIPIPHVRTRGGQPWRLTGVPHTFSYYKLHGSLNFYTHEPPFQNFNLYHKHHDEVDELAEGLKTFIVPPTTGKQAFIEHPTLQAIWAKAADLLKNNCGRIIIFGYSMPETDTTVLSMLRSTIQSIDTPYGMLPQILVVNPDSGAARHFQKLLGLPNPIGQVTNVAAFLEQFAPTAFVRTHVWDNRHYSDVLKQEQIRLEYPDNEDERRRRTIESLAEARDNGRLGIEWFLSSEELVQWRRMVILDAPVDRWL